MLKVALSTFALVFLAELGDKTQLTVFALAAETTTPWGVLIGAGAALLLSTVLAVLLAVAVHHMIPEAWTKWIRVAAGAAIHPCRNLDDLEGLRAAYGPRWRFDQPRFGVGTLLYPLVGPPYRGNVPSARLGEKLEQGLRLLSPEI